MSLIKQLWLTILILLLLAFGGSLTIGILASKQYIEQELRIKNNDNANALALSLSQLEKAPVIVELLVAAQFDTGHYRLIELSAPDGRVIERRVNNADIDSAPGWFVELVDFDVPAGRAVIQDGWQQYATLILESHHGYAYRSLWQSAIELLLWFAAAALISAALAWWVVCSIRRPLHAVVNQARDIGQRRFTTSRKPRIRELRQVVVAMNHLSGAVRDMLTEETRKLDRLRRRLQQDEVTGVAKRETLLNRLDAILTSDDRSASGYLALVRLANLGSLNTQLGYAATDQLLIEIAKRLSELAAHYDGGQVGRLKGSDFALIAPGAEDAKALSEALSALVYSLADKTSCVIELPLALVTYNQGDSRSELLSALDGALAKAEAHGGRTVEIADNSNKRHPYRSHDEWRRALSDALASRGVSLARFPVLGADKQLIHYECPARLELNGELQSAGVFLPWVSRVGLSRDFDLAVIDCALRTIDQEKQPLGINLSSEAICDMRFIAALRQSLLRYPQATDQLWLELPESAAVRHMQAFRNLCQELHPFGCKIGLEHVGPDYARLDDLHELGLAYLKIDASLIRDIHLQSEAQPFLRGIATLNHSIGVWVIAEGVSNDAERDMLFELGFDGVTGPGVSIVK